ncbi:MAG: selenocysteine-specific translation elongation factor [Betaproteobacteria bacterium RIFCSPLOWO2_02_FULL_62_17]|nr:MAG: selenocysteine-specific translation elongation factor [Betaproteobacteria bacterium RIFCSPLOWO2_02_FULL_62_17]
MPYIVGTAGHIDHGKTSLVKALTGQDTDRLKEEKERGISIDLGFAHLDLPDGTQAGVVDVPGHERFVRNMLAGAHGIDLVLFSVAADDGVMPQTEEHFDIVRLLGVTHGIFVITKADLASAERIREVEEEIEMLAADTAFAGAPMLPFSAVTRQGLPELRAAIVQGLAQCASAAPEGYFRMPVDRAFTLQGHGLVVTGTAHSGSVGIGEHLRCLPDGERFRVRGIQVHGRTLENAGWGQRVALNLAGSETASVKRGQVLCHEKIARTSTRFDAFAEIPRAGTRGLRSHQRVRVHLGTAEILAKVVFLHGKDKVESRESACCQITLDEPALVMRGDHFIIRDEVARRTIGGGIVIHPWAGRHKPRETRRMEKLETLRRGDFPELVNLLLEESETPVLPLDAMCQFFNLTANDVAVRLSRVKSALKLNLEGEQLFVSQTRWQTIGDAALKLVGAFHKAQPLAAGMDLEDLRAKLRAGLSPGVYRFLIDQRVAAKALAREGNLVRLPGHSVNVGGTEKALMEKIRAILGKDEMAPPDLPGIEKETGALKPKLIEVLKLLEREGGVVRVGPELYFLAGAVEKVKTALRAHLAEHGTITAAGFRDLIGSTRKYVIPFLEYFDRTGFTIRVGDNRKLKSPVKAG